MKKRTCIELNNLPFPVKLEQTGKDRFTVTYGQQIKRFLPYAEAARELGECIMHALCLDNKIKTD